MEGSRDLGETARRRVRQINMGRDEMNLAEFPLATLADRAPRGCKTLVFEDQIRDRGQGQDVARRLTISASDRYGLPTARDEEVILGLVQLSKAQHFGNRCVPFSRYQLVRLLGWRDEGRSYIRLEESLKRWIGVTLYYENAWRDNCHKRWVNAHFHLLDGLVIGRRPTVTSRPGKRKKASPESSFTWNEIVFRSFQSGYLKKLDMDFYRTLKSSVAKRIYRFLDKRFYFSRQWQQGLRRFACEHVGLSRSYDASQLKRRLNPAIRELEDAGYLEPLPLGERYRRIEPGEWDVVFVHAAKASRTSVGLPDVSALEARLVDRGVTVVSAARLVRKYPSDRIEAKLATFDKLVAKQDKKISRNAAGYLVQSIRDDYLSPDDRHCRRLGSMGRRSMVDSGLTVKDNRRPSLESDLSPAEQTLLRNHLSRLSMDELGELEAEAMKAAPRLLTQSYARAKASGSRNLIGEYRQCLLEHHLRKVLGLGRGRASNGHVHRK